MTYAQEIDDEINEINDVAEILEEENDEYVHQNNQEDRALWFFSTRPQRTNLNVQTGLRSNEGSVLEKSLFSDRG